MKKSLNILVFVMMLFVAQACGSKSDKISEANATGTPVVKTANVTLTPAEKRAKIAKQKADMLEKRRTAYEAWAKNHPTFTDSDGNIIYSVSEVSPAYPGGEEAMEKFLRDHINYPKESQDNGDEGTVFVDFIVGSDGVVRDVRATDESGYNMDQDLRDESVRLVGSMPKWSPGRQNGKAVQVKFSLPVTFMLN